MATIYNKGYKSVHTGKEIDSLFNRIQELEQVGNTFVINSDRENSGFKGGDRQGIVTPNDEVFIYSLVIVQEPSDKEILASEVQLGDTIRVLEPKDAPDYWVYSKGIDAQGKQYFNVRVIDAVGGMTPSEKQQLDEATHNIQEIQKQVNTNKEDISLLVEDKQDKLIPGVGITIGEDGKTINATCEVEISQATETALGGIKASPKTDKEIVEVKIDTTTGKLYAPAGSGESYTLPTASKEVLGGVKIGDGITITEDGTISATGGGGSYILPQATGEVLGGIKAKAKTTEDTQEIHIDTETGMLYTKPGTGGGGESYTLPVAKAETLGGVKIGANINVTEDGTISTHDPYTLPDDVVHDTSYVHTDENFTTAEKEKLTNLENYDDTAINQSISNINQELKNKLDSVPIANNLTVGGITAESVIEGSDYTEDVKIDPSTGKLFVKKQTGGGTTIDPVTITVVESEEAKEQLTDMKHGDIVIVKNNIDNEKQLSQLTTYIYDSSIPNWIATDQNYNAENVYFKDNLIMTYDFGKYKAGGKSVSVPAAGMSVKEVLLGAFSEDQNPTVRQPSTSISLNKTSASVEIGAHYTETITATLKTYGGSYQYGSKGPDGEKYSDTSTGVIFYGHHLENSKNQNIGETTLSVDLDIPNVDMKQVVTFSGQASHYESPRIPLTKLGVEKKDLKIIEGDDIASSQTFTVTSYRNHFCGYKDAGNLLDVKNLTADQMRTLEKHTLPTVLETRGMQQIFFAIKPDTYSKVEVSNAVNGAPQTVKHTTLLIPGANNYSPVTYDIFYVDNAAPDGGDAKYNIKYTK